MPEWDNVENCEYPYGYFTIYTPQYDDELKDKVYSIDCKKSNDYIHILIDYFERSLENTIENEDEDEYDLIGINSNSFTSNLYKHNIFMEWDKSHHLPNIEDLKKLKGTITETEGGLHFLKKADLSWKELTQIQIDWDCCHGFQDYSKRRQCSCLRICPKVGNKIKIIELENSFLGEIYKQTIDNLEEVYNGLVR